MSSGSSGFEQAQQLLTVLQQRQLKIVFAESCTRSEERRVGKECW